MSLWTKTDAAAGAPKYPGVDIGISAQANGSTMFGNTQIAAFQVNHNITAGIFGVDTTEQSVSASSNTHPQHAGWVLVKKGTGPIATISANASSYSPDGNVYLTFSGGGSGTTAANAQIITNGAKAITGITLNSGGNYDRAPVVGTVANSNVAITITMGGRAGRVQTETLVAMGSMTSDASDDAIFPDA